MGGQVPAVFQVLHQLCFYSRVQPFVEVALLVQVHFIKNGNHRFVVGVHVLQYFVYHPNLIFVLQMAEVHHMQQHIGFPHFIQGAFEALHKVCGQLANKPNGIA